MTMDAADLSQLAKPPVVDDPFQQLLTAVETRYHELGDAIRHCNEARQLARLGAMPIKSQMLMAEGKLRDAVRDRDALRAANADLGRLAADLQVQVDTLLQKLARAAKKSKPKPRAKPRATRAKR